MLTTSKTILERRFFAEDETIIKYQSFVSLGCRVLLTKKIFIFRRLKDHLEKIISKTSAMKNHLDTNLHPLFSPYCLLSKVA